MSADIKKTRNRNKTGNGELIIWNVPKTVKEKFKIACIRKGIHMRKAIIDLMIDFSK